MEQKGQELREESKLQHKELHELESDFELKEERNRNLFGAQIISIKNKVEKIFGLYDNDDLNLRLTENEHKQIDLINVHKYLDTELRYASEDKDVGKELSEYMKIVRTGYPSGCRYATYDDKKIMKENKSWQGLYNARDAYYKKLHAQLVDEKIRAVYLKFIEVMQ